MQVHHFARRCDENGSQQDELRNLPTAINFDP